MGLNKKICQKCFENSHKQDGSTLWRSYDDELWEDGEVECPYDYDKYSVYIHEDPPKSCPFILEHIIKENGKENGKENENA